MLRTVCTLFLSTLMLFSASVDAGRIFLTGHDPDYHALNSVGAQKLMQVGLDYVTGGTTNTITEKFLFVMGDIPVPSGHRDSVVAGLNSIGLVEGDHFDVVHAADIEIVDFSAYTAIVVASNFGGILTRAELDALIARKADIAAFVNSGGGLFASAECDACGADLLGDSPDLFGFVPVDVLSIAPAQPYTVTAFGMSEFGLVDADVNDPSHNAFLPVEGLNIVDVDSSGNPMTLAGDVVIGDGGFEPTEGAVCIYQEETAGLDDFALLGWVSPYDRAGETAVEVYSYGNPVGSSYSNLDPAAVGGLSQIFFVNTSDSDGVSMFFVHDQASDGSGGTADWTVTLSGGTAAVLVQDDGGEITDNGGTVFGVGHTWAPCCTDGGVIGTLDGDWSLTIDLDAAFSGIDNWEVLSSGGSAVVLNQEFVENAGRRVRMAPCEVEPQAPLSKMLTEGPDRDADGVIDSIIEVKQQQTTKYVWQIKYNNPEGPDVLILDTAPAESIVTGVNGQPVAIPCGGSITVGNVDIWRGGKLGNDCHSSTHFAWMPESDDEVLTVSVETRESPGKGHIKQGRRAFAPTSCGALYLNDGAVAYALNSDTGEPIEQPPILESNQLCIAAVKEPTEFGATADNDGDGLADVDEVCHNEIRTNPCKMDTDGDGLTDGEELELGTDPTDTDTDGDGLPDGSDPDPLTPADPA